MADECSAPSEACGSPWRRWLPSRVGMRTGQAVSCRAVRVWSLAEHRTAEREKVLRATVGPLARELAPDPLVAGSQHTRC